MTQMRFDLEAGERAKGHGMAAAATAEHERLDLARLYARLHAEEHGTVTADDVQMNFSEPFGASAGSLFRGPEWEFTGQWVKSRRVSNHARAIRVWRLK